MDSRNGGNGPHRSPPSSFPAPASAAPVRLGLILAFLAYASWGLLSPVGKHLLEDFEPATLNMVRFLVAAAVALPFLGVRGLRDSLRLLRRPAVLWLNLLANLSLALFLYSLTRLEATWSTLGFYTAPLWTALLAWWMLDENVGRSFAPAALGLLAGGYLVLFGLAAPADGFSTAGLLLAVASGLVWAAYAVELRKHGPAIPLKPLAGASFLFAAAFFTLLALPTEGVPDLAAVPRAAWGWMAVHVAFPTLAALVLFNAALQRAPASLANLLVGAELAFTALFAWLLFEDTFSRGQVAGLALVLGSVTAYLWGRGRRVAEAVTAAA